MLIVEGLESISEIKLKENSPRDLMRSPSVVTERIEEQKTEHIQARFQVYPRGMNDELNYENDQRSKFSSFPWRN